MDKSRAKILPILRVAGLRSFATKPQTCKNIAVKNVDVEKTVLQNKVVVASTDGCTPISRVSIVFRAGSRYETYETQGASHYLRAAAGLSTSKSSAFAITRKAQQIGANLYVTSDRESITYTVEATRDTLDTALTTLKSMTVGQLFKPWEVSDLTPRIKDDIKRISNEVRAIDLLHKVAFQETLGNSIYVPKHQIGKLSSETLQHFYITNCSADRSAVVGLGVCHKTLAGFAQGLQLELGSGKNNESKYQGPGEIRFDKSGSRVAVAIATAGVSSKDSKEALVYSVLQYAYGINPSVKYGANNGSISRAVDCASKNVRYTTFNANYSDNGLFGLVLSGNGKDIHKAIDAGLKGLKSGSLTDAEISRGKNGLKAATIFAFENNSKLLRSMGNSAVLSGTFTNLEEMISAIDSISAADVNEAAKKVAAGKFSIASVGNLAEVPYVNNIN